MASIHSTGRCRARRRFGLGEWIGWRGIQSALPQWDRLRSALFSQGLAHPPLGHLYFLFPFAVTSGPTPWRGLAPSEAELTPSARVPYLSPQVPTLPLGQFGGDVHHPVPSELLGCSPGKALWLELRGTTPGLAQGNRETRSCLEMAGG